MPGAAESLLGQERTWPPGGWREQKASPSPSGLNPCGSILQPPPPPKTPLAVSRAAVQGSRSLRKTVCFSGLYNWRLTALPFSKAFLRGPCIVPHVPHSTGIITPLPTPPASQSDTCLLGHREDPKQFLPLSSPPSGHLSRRLRAAAPVWARGEPAPAPWGRQAGRQGSCQGLWGACGWWAPGGSSPVVGFFQVSGQLALGKDVEERGLGAVGG